MPKVKYFIFNNRRSKTEAVFLAITSDIPDGKMCHTNVL